MIDIWESLLRTASALAIVLVLMGLLALAARRVMGGRLGVVGTGPLVQVVASGYIAPRKTIALVSVAGEYLIVGATANDLVSFGRVVDPGKVQALLAASPSVPSAAPSGTPSALLASWLHQLTAGRGPDKGNHGDR